MRVFRLTLNGVIASGRVAALIQVPRYQRQVDVLVVAPSKAAAYGLASAMPDISVPSRSDPDFRLATGNEVDALAAAGQLDHERVLAYKTERSAVVVEVKVDGRHQVIGRLVQGPLYSFTFELAGGV